MAIAKRLQRQKDKGFCPTCGRRLQTGYPGGLPFDINVLTEEQKRALYEEVGKDSPFICGVPKEEFKKLSWDERDRLMRGGTLAT
jgi:hypothetical protein